jgi:pimeloyl-ACP methyl ester carboxylesterase
LNAAQPNKHDARADAAGVRRVVLLHGLWMPAASMQVLARRLARRGFEPELFGYATIAGGPERAVPRLAEHLARAPCHVLAHSLGGLLTVQTLRAEPALPVARAVCLGSPLCGSAAADGVARLLALGRLLGQSAGLLRSGCTPWRGRAQLGVVAGCRPRGLGQLFGRFDGPCDGTVAVAETRLPGLADHVVIDASHCGLLLSGDAAALAAHFFTHGRFRGADETQAAPALG